MKQSQFIDILCKDFNIDSQYKYIREFKSISEASVLTKTNRISISLCINNK